MKLIRQCLLVLLGMAFLNANAAHLHLCLDGKESRTTVHVFDGPEEVSHAAASEGHNDMDVKLADQALAKLFKAETFPPALPSSWKAPEVKLAETISSFNTAVDQFISSVRFLVPPLRGPPA